MANDSQYPAQIDTIDTNKSNSTKTLDDHAYHHNILGDATNKIERELGVNPSGSLPDLVTRLNVTQNTDGTLKASVTAQGLNPTPVKTANYNAIAFDFVPVDTTSGPLNIILPTAPADATRVGIKLVTQGGTNTVTVNVGGLDVFNKTGGSTILTLKLLNQAVIVQYKASLAVWYVISDDLSLAQLDLRYVSTVNLLHPYVLTTDGTNVQAYSSTGTTLYTGTDGGAAFQAALTALPSTGGEIIFTDYGGSGTFPFTGTIPQIPVNISDKLIVRGNGRAKIRLSTTANRFAEPLQRVTQISSATTQPATTLPVLDTTNFDASGYVSVAVTTGRYAQQTELFSYTGKTGTTLTGCIKLNGAGGTIPQNAYVSQAYDTMQNVEFRDLIIDGNNVAPSFATHVVFGSEISGDNMYRLNYKNIVFNNIRTINVPAASPTRQNMHMILRCYDSAETVQLTAIDIVQRSCNFQGGMAGFVVAGACTLTPTNGPNMWIDRIFTYDSIHDTGTVPTSTLSSANWQFGSYARCGTIRQYNCHGYNSWDVGIEVDNCQDYRAEGCSWTDSWVSKHLSRNFRTPLDVNSQKSTLIGCHFYSKNIARSSGGAGSGSADFYILGDASTLAYYFGELEIIDCVTADTITAQPVGAYVINANGCQFKKLTVRDLSISYSALNVSTGANIFSQTIISPRNVGAIVDIDGINFRLTGTRSGSGNNTWRFLQIDGTDADVKIRRMSVDHAGLTGVTSGSDTFYWNIFGGVIASTLAIDLDGLECVSSNPGNQQCIYLSGNGPLTLRGRAFIQRIDLGRLSGLPGFDVFMSTNSLRANTIVQNTISTRFSSPIAGNSGVAIDPVTVTANTTMGYPQAEGLYANATSGAITITLPDAQAVPKSKSFWIKRINTNANNVIINTGSSQTIDGNLTYTIGQPYQTLNVISDGTNWQII